MKRFLIALVALMLAGPVVAQSGPLRLTITDGVIEPLPFAVPSFEPENAEAAQVAADITRLVALDLSGTGLFREIPASAFISAHSSFAQTVAYPDWRAINAQAMISGAVTVSFIGRVFWHRNGRRVAICRHCRWMASHGP